MNNIEINDDAQADLVFETIDELLTLLRLKQAFLNYKFIHDAENANRALDQIRESLFDVRRSVFGLTIIPSKGSIND